MTEEIKCYTAKMLCGHTARISVEPYSGDWGCMCGSSSVIKRSDWKEDKRAYRFAQAQVSK